MVRMAMDFVLLSRHSILPFDFFMTRHNEALVYGLILMKDRIAAERASKCSR
jgi:hypothetical protein